MFELFTLGCVAYTTYRIGRGLGHWLVRKSIGDAEYKRLREYN